MDALHTTLVPLLTEEERHRIKYIGRGDDLGYGARKMHVGFEVVVSPEWTESVLTWMALKIGRRDKNGNPYTLYDGERHPLAQHDELGFVPFRRWWKDHTSYVLKAASALLTKHGRNLPASDEEHMKDKVRSKEEK